MRKHFVVRIIEAITNKKPQTIRYKNKRYNVTKSIINQYHNRPLNIIDETLMAQIEEVAKTGGILPLLPLIFAGLAAAGGIAGGAAGIAKAVNDKTAADAEQKETERHNREMEKLAKGQGLTEVLGTIKDFGKKFSKETRKSVKEGLISLADKINITKQGEGLYLSPKVAEGQGLYLNPYKNEQKF